MEEQRAGRHQVWRAAVRAEDSGVRATMTLDLIEYFDPREGWAWRANHWTTCFHGGTPHDALGPTPQAAALVALASWSRGHGTVVEELLPPGASTTAELIAAEASRWRAQVELTTTLLRGVDWTRWRAEVASTPLAAQLADAPGFYDASRDAAVLTLGIADAIAAQVARERDEANARAAAAEASTAAFARRFNAAAYSLREDPTATGERWSVCRACGCEGDDPHDPRCVVAAVEQMLAGCP
ncbi:MAG: hypothetical protein Q8S73_38515 [Deltaproteobacteria bacterium]|nr:hypothetical protein [Myxococcales bacterium]MDP3220058.1 hypothetical protein [Deltaproteobacteria bacterium]